ncbi:MAG: DMT family transporter [Pseudomonadota bacterium]
MFYFVLAFLTGVSIVVNMVLNGRLAQREGMINSVAISYLSAAAASILLCAVMLGSIPSYSSIRKIPLPYFLGGAIGVLTTYLFNLIVPKVPAIYIVILRFTGQMLAGAAIDYIFLDIFSRGKLIGGALFLAGLVINARLDDLYARQELDRQNGMLIE